MAPGPNDVTLSDGRGGVVYLPPDDPVYTVVQSLHQKAVAALTANQTFLALASPTNAQAVAQVQALTRQVDALIRLAVGAITDTAGT